MNTPQHPAPTRAEIIDHLITITCGGMIKVCHTKSDWELRELNMREFARLLLETPLPPA